MEMDYKINPDFTLGELEFTGLTGSEHVFSVKEALSYLTIKNPVTAFAESVKNGAYAELNDDEYEEVVATMRAIVGLFRYDDKDEETLSEMNVLMLLKNAIIGLVKRDVALRQ